MTELSCQAPDWLFEQYGIETSSEIIMLNPSARYVLAVRVELLTLGQQPSAKLEFTTDRHETIQEGKSLWIPARNDLTYHAFVELPAGLTGLRLKVPPTTKPVAKWDVQVRQIKTGE